VLVLLGCADLMATAVLSRDFLSTGAVDRPATPGPLAPDPDAGSQELNRQLQSSAAHRELLTRPGADLIAGRRTLPEAAPALAAFSRQRKPAWLRGVGRSYPGHPEASVAAALVYFTQPGPEGRPFRHGGEPELPSHLHEDQREEEHQLEGGHQGRPAEVRHRVGVAVLEFLGEECPLLLVEDPRPPHRQDADVADRKGEQGQDGNRQEAEGVDHGADAEQDRKPLARFLDADAEGRGQVDERLIRAGQQQLEGQEDAGQRGHGKLLTASTATGTFCRRRHRPRHGLIYRQRAT
jgi:hypothetical protein